MLRYKPSDELLNIPRLVHAGYKAAILDVASGTGNPVAPENVDAYEVGFKYSGGVLNNDSNRNVPLTITTIRTFRRLRPPAIPRSPRSSTRPGRNLIGFEAQLSANPVRGLTVSAGGAYVHGRYTDFPNAPFYRPCTAAEFGDGTCAQGAAFIVEATALEDVTMQRTPGFTGNISAIYETPLANGELQLSGNLYYTSAFSLARLASSFRRRLRNALASRTMERSQ